MRETLRTSPGTLCSTRPADAAATTCPPEPASGCARPPPPPLPPRTLRRPVRRHKRQQVGRRRRRRREKRWLLRSRQTCPKQPSSMARRWLSRRCRHCRPSKFTSQSGGAGPAPLSVAGSRQPRDPRMPRRRHSLLWHMWYSGPRLCAAHRISRPPACQRQLDKRRRARRAQGCTPWQLRQGGKQQVSLQRHPAAAGLQALGSQRQPLSSKV